MGSKGPEVSNFGNVNQKAGRNILDKRKPYEISKKAFVIAYRAVKKNAGAAGVDGVTLEEYERTLQDNLYKLWNRLSSGSYMPKPVRGIAIPKKDGGTRILGIPTVEDRIAQMVARLYFEPRVEPEFREDSYGYRPNKSALDAIRVTRERCWKEDWVVEFDIKRLFDCIDHELLMRAVRKHTDLKWIQLYTERWIKAPIMMSDGKIEKRESGTPQGGVISPILANLFMHYAFDRWMERKHPSLKWVRYADDGLVHCRTQIEAREVMSTLKARMKECKLEIHPEKSRIVYCKDYNRSQSYEITSFDFLGYTFRPRRVRSQKGRVFIGFGPGASKLATKKLRMTIRSWKLHKRVQQELTELAQWMNPIVRGWINYYGYFQKRELHTTMLMINRALTLWARRKYKKMKRKKSQSIKWLHQHAEWNPNLFAHWAMGYKPTG
jgi:RNA-directed DNA polymerase